MDHRGPHNHQQHHSNHRQQFETMIQNPSYPTTDLPLLQVRFPFNPTYPIPEYTHDGSGSRSGSGELAIDPHSNKKRGRPRKYSHNDNAGSGGGGGGGIDLGLSPAIGFGGAHHEEGGGIDQRKHRGRPPGSGKKQLDALGNCGVGFTPHVILVNAGEIIVGSFIADGKRIKSMPTVPNSHTLSFSSPPRVAGSPPSQGAASSEEGSEENASNHIDPNMGSYTNSNHPIHQHNMQMYTQMGWSNSGLKMPNHQM